MEITKVVTVENFKQKDPFDIDMLDRKFFAENIIGVLKRSDKLFDKEASVIAIDSGWGTGKTYFLNMFEKRIECENKWKVIRYDAWADDDWGDPMIPLFSKVVEALAKPNNKIEECAKELLWCLGKGVVANLGKKLLSGVADDLIDFINGIESEELKDIFKLEDTETAMKEALKNPRKSLNKILKSKHASDFIEKQKYSYDALTEYKQFVKMRDDFKMLLEASINSKAEKLIVFIDELDRCRPTYAIETLETIKHFFNIPNVIFIVLLDMEQLGYSVQKLYGSNVDQEGYLMRFFGFHFKLPDAPIGTYIRMKFDGKKSWELSNEIIECFVTTAVDLLLTARDVNVLYNNIGLLSLSTLSGEDRLDTWAAYLYLLCLKYKYNEIYRLITRKRYLHSALGSNPYLNEVGSEKKYFLMASSTAAAEVVSYMNNDDQEKIVHNRPGGLERAKRLNEILIIKSDSSIIDTLEAYSYGKYIESKLGLFNYNWIENK